MVLTATEDSINEGLGLVVAYLKVANKELFLALVNAKNVASLHGADFTQRIADLKESVDALAHSVQDAKIAE